MDQSADFQRAARAVAQLETAVQYLGRYFPAPTICEVPGGPGWRHAQKDRLLASYIKCIFICDSLHAGLALLLNGFVHQAYAICRGIEDAADDIRFLAIPPGQDPKTDRDQERLLNEFFQEEWLDESPVPFKIPAKRDRVDRKNIHAALMKLQGTELDPSTIRHLLNTLHKSFSGYVHGAYVHVMDLYDGNRFMTRGQLGTPPQAEAVKTYANYVYRAHLAVRVLAKSLGDGDLDVALKKMGDDYAKEAGCYFD